MAEDHVQLSLSLFRLKINISSPPFDAMNGIELKINNSDKNNKNINLIFKL